jgi:hypothetical protein
MNRWKFRLGILAVFVLGAVVGSLGTGLYISHRVERFFHGPPGRFEERIMSRLTHELDLNPAEREEIAPIVRDALGQLEAFRRQQAWPQFQRILDDTVARIRPKLRPEQQAELDHSYTRLKDHFQRP